MHRPRVTQILYSGVGGHGAVALGIVHGDTERFLDQSFVYYGVEELAPGHRAACEALGIAHRAVRKQPGFDWRAIRAVVDALEVFDPEVILLHSVVLAPVVAAWCQARRRSLVVIDHQTNQMKSRRDHVLAAVAHVLADRVVVLTEAFSKELEAILGPIHRPNRVRIIGNGIDVESYARARKPRSLPSHGSIVIGMHSRFVPHKDHATIIRALARLRAEGRDVRLELAGDGDTRKGSEELADRLGVARAVTFRGALAERDIAAFLAGLDVYVQSTLGETMSIAVMQAMSAGLPIVATDAPGLKPMLTDGRTALFFPIGDDGALAAALRRLFDEPNLGLIYGSASQAQARDAFAQTRTAKQYGDLVRELTGNSLPMGSEHVIVRTSVGRDASRGARVHELMEPMDEA
jgi:glycosyltransferase involved in cell wall biosynthesis